MNFAGKVFVVLIFIASLAFMTVAAVMYGTHRDLEAAAKEKQAELQAARTEFDGLLEQYNSVSTELQSQRASQLQQVRKLESERVALIARDDAVRTEMQRLIDANRVATTDLKEAELKNEALIVRNEELRGEIKENQEAADAAFTGSVEVVEEIHQLQGDLESLAERNADLTLQNQQASGGQ